MITLVTGAGGFIGGHLVAALADVPGMKITAIDKKPGGMWRQYHTRPNVINVEGDIVDYGDKSGFVFEIVFHLAALAGVRDSFEDPAGYVRNNVQGTVRALEIARQSNATFIYAGSSTADFTIDANPYALTKYQGEQLITMYRKIYGSSVAIARFYNVYGPYQSEPGDGNPYCNVMGTFEKQYRECKKLTVTGDGTQRRDFTHVYDIVSGLLAISEHVNTKGTTRGFGIDDDLIYNIGTGENYSISEIAEKFNSASGIEYIDRPQGEAETSLADNSRLRDLGWEPTNNIMDYIEQVRWDNCPKGSTITR
jgi:UDP-glucose 4-epimerase